MLWLPCSLASWAFCSGTIQATLQLSGILPSSSDSSKSLVAELRSQFLLHNRGVGHPFLVPCTGARRIWLPSPHLYLVVRAVVAPPHGLGLVQMPPPPAEVGRSSSVGFVRSLLWFRFACHCFQGWYST